MRLATFVDGADVGVEFADTGKGISSEQLQRLFEPGINAEDSPVKAAIGLIICLPIVRKHRGTIRVASEPGRSTTFIAQLRIGEPALS